MRNLTAFIVILVGVGLLLNATGSTTLSNFIGTWWSLVLILIGLNIWFTNRRSFFVPSLLILLGVFFILNNQGYIAGNVWNYFWPVVIILVGVRMLWRRPWGEVKTTGNGRDMSVAFSGREERVHGEFTRSTINAVFGGTKLDLREAQIKDGAVIDVFAAFGGAEILVPKNVRCETHVTPLFGGAENKTNPDAGASITLHINGTALFGGVSVKN